MEKCTSALASSSIKVIAYFKAKNEKAYWLGWSLALTFIILPTLNTAIGYFVIYEVGIKTSVRRYLLGCLNLPAISGVKLNIVVLLVLLDLFF